MRRHDGDATSGSSKPAPVKSADRVMQVLEVLSTSPGGLSIADVRDQLGLPKSSAHALLTTMTSRGFVAFDPLTQHFSIGLRVWELAQHATAGIGDLAAVADPYLATARDELNEVVQVAVLDGIYNVYIARKDANQSLTLVSQVGVRLPAHTTGLGKAMLASLTDEEVRSRYAGHVFTAVTARTITSVDELVTDLAHIRTRGYSVDQGEYTDGVHCTAMPIRDHRRQIVAAASVSVPLARMTPSLGERVHAELIKAVTGISTRLGCPWSPPTTWYGDPPTAPKDVVTEHASR